MKPSLTLLCLIALSAVPASASETFSGPYASVIAGLERAHVQEGDASAIYTNGVGTYSAHRGNNSTSSGFGGGLGFGWDHRVGNQVVGAEATITLQNTQAVGTAFTGYHSSPTDDHLNTNTRLTEAAALKLKYGFVFGKELNRMAYLTAGLAQAHVQRTLTQENDHRSNQWLNYGDSVNQTKTVLGYTAGFGGETYVCDRVSVKGEFDYANYGGTSFDYARHTTALGANVRFSENVHLSNLGFNLAAAYHF